MNSRETRSRKREREREEGAKSRKKRPIVGEHAIPILLIHRYALGTGSNMEDCSVNKTEFGGLQGNSSRKIFPLGAE